MKLSYAQKHATLERIFGMGAERFQQALEDADVSATDIALLFREFYLQTMERMKTRPDMDVSRQVAWICDHWKDWSKFIDQSGIQEKFLAQELKKGNAALMRDED